MSLGSWSRPFGIVSCLWLFGSSFFFFLPTLYPVTNSNMNWLTVVTGGVFLMCSLNWFFNSSYHFTGPRRHNSIAPDAPGKTGGHPEEGGVSIKQKNPMQVHP
jgi:hypothetical protein